VNRDLDWNAYNPHSKSFSKYRGVEVIERWFEDWNKRGTVMVWDIKQFIHQENMTVVEWYFKCKYDGDVGEFDGVSLIEDLDRTLVASAMS